MKIELHKESTNLHACLKLYTDDIRTQHENFKNKEPKIPPMPKLESATNAHESSTPR